MRIAVLDDYQNVARGLADWTRIPGAELTTFQDHLSDQDALVHRLGPFDVLMVIRERTPLPAALIDRLPNLKLIVTAARRNASIDIEACQRRGIAVCGTAASGAPVVEVAWAFVLNHMRHVAREDRALRNGQWQTTLGRSLDGATLGVVGLGKLGTRMTQLGTAFGMKPVCWSPNLTEVRAAAAGAKLVSKDELFATSDIVTLHLVLGGSTRHVVGAEELARMKRTALLVNTSRGPLVDENALVHALRTEMIGGAALDVFDIEPLPLDHPFISLPNTQLTPHLGYVTEQNYRAYFADAVEDIEAWLAGRSIRVVEPVASR
jgi:phosphoglycerate dehydrogenase-like enzyme